MKLASKCDTHVHAPRRDVTMIFETREPDYPKIKADLDIAAAMIRKADSFTDAKEAFRRYNEAYKELSSRYARIFLKLYHDVSCEETMVQLAASIEHLNELVHYAPFGSAVAESPWRDQLEACYGKPAILLLAFNADCESRATGNETKPRTIDEASSRYQNLVIQAEGCYERFADEFDALLQEVVSINHETARYYGYEDYNDYANLLYSRFDYGEAEMMNLCRQIREKVVPCYEVFQKTYANQLQQGAPKPRDLRQGMAAYTERLGKEAAEYWLMLSDTDALDIEPSPVKMPNMGLQRLIEEEGLAPIITNPTGDFNDGWVLAHEFGHSFQEYLAFRKQPLALSAVASADVMEISSRLAELFLHVHADRLYEDPERFSLFHLDRLLSSIINFAMSTEFEHWLYHHVDATPQQRKETYFSLYRQTHPSATADETTMLRSLYDEVTVYTMPKYQFCYVPAWISAVEIAKDYRKQSESVYRKFVELNGDLAFYTYRELAQKFGFSNAFEDGIVDRFIGWLEECTGLRLSDR